MAREMVAPFHETQAWAKPKTEARQSLVDAEEDLLRQILRHGAVADEPEHVVEHGQLVRANDERERSLISSLSLPQDAEIRLGQRQVRGSIASETGIGSGASHAAQALPGHRRRNLETQEPQGRGS